MRTRAVDRILVRINGGRRPSRPALLALGATALGLLVSAIAFAAMIDDVVERNGLTRQDGSRLGWFVHHRPGWLVSTARWVTDGGNVPVLLVVAVVAGLLLYLRGQALVAAATPLIALLTAGAATAVLKPLVGRARPPIGLRLLSETEPSFPSGHATDSTALFVSLALVVAVVVLRRPLARAASVGAGFAVAGLIGLTRLVLGVHWPTDVMAGWALGTAIALTVTTAGLFVARHPPADPTVATRVGMVTRRLSRLLQLERPVHQLGMAIVAVAIVAAGCSSGGSSTATVLPAPSTARATGPSAATTAPPSTASPTSEEALAKGPPYDRKTGPSGSGCTPPADAATLPAGWWAGKIKNVNGSSFDFDLVCWFSGQAAIKAGGEDNAGPVEDDYYVRNSDPKVYPESFTTGSAPAKCVGDANQPFPCTVADILGLYAGGQTSGTVAGKQVTAFSTVWLHVTGTTPDYLYMQFTP